MIAEIILFLAVLGSLLAGFFIAEANRNRLDIKKINIKKWIGLKWFRRLNDLIERSTIAHYIPYNVTLHVGISLATFFMCFTWIRQYMPLIVSVGFGAMGLYIPSLLISLIADVAHKSNSKKINNLMLMLSNELFTTNNVFEAIEGTTHSVKGALLDHLEDVASDQIIEQSEAKVLQKLKRRINHQVFTEYIDNMVFMLINGGDISQLTDDVSEELTEMNEIVEKEDADDFMMKLLVYLMIFIDVVAIISKMGSSYQVDWGTTIWGQVILTLNSICIIKMADSTITQKQGG